MIQSRWDWPEWLAYLVPFMTIAGFIFGVSSAITWNAGRAAGTIHNPSGKGTPYRQEYSRAAALVIRGNYDEAVEAYREHIAEQPEDPEPYLRLARLLRDQLDRYDDAAHWFKAARQSARITARQEVFITRELIELATDKLRDPARAAPELARLIERFPGAPEAVWARTELREIKKQIGEA
jgi:tetratricopeptide (TPR) repeat protein